MFSWETEEWTHRLIDRLNSSLPLPKQKPFRVLDVCTGTGCIALALAARLLKHSADIVAMDISAEAIALARLNWQIHQQKLRNKITFLHQDVFSLPSSGVPFDLIVSNHLMSPIRSMTLWIPVSGTGKTGVPSWQPITARPSTDRSSTWPDIFRKHPPCHGLSWRSVASTRWMSSPRCCIITVLRTLQFGKTWQEKTVPW